MNKFVVEWQGICYTTIIREISVGRDDMRKMKKYILDTFKYRELGENFTKKMKEAAKELKT